jgi:hypothetical protein
VSQNVLFTLPNKTQAEYESQWDCDGNHLLQNDRWGFSSPAVPGVMWPRYLSVALDWASGFAGETPAAYLEILTNQASIQSVKKRDLGTPLIEAPVGNLTLRTTSLGSATATAVDAAIATRLVNTTELGNATSLDNTTTLGNTTTRRYKAGRGNATELHLDDDEESTLKYIAASAKWPVVITLRKGAHGAAGIARAVDYRPDGLGCQRCDRTQCAASWDAVVRNNGKPTSCEEACFCGVVRLKDVRGSQKDVTYDRIDRLFDDMDTLSTIRQTEESLKSILGIKVKANSTVKWDDLIEDTPSTKTAVGTPVPKSSDAVIGAVVVTPITSSSAEPAQSSATTVAASGTGTPGHSAETSSAQGSVKRRAAENAGAPIKRDSYGDERALPKLIRLGHGEAPVKRDEYSEDRGLPKLIRLPSKRGRGGRQ